jgi:hypothetical protein
MVSSELLQGYESSICRVWQFPVNRDKVLVPF